MYVYFSYQPNVEMNWNMKKYLPTAASCQSYFQVHLSFLKHSVVYTPSPIAKLKTHLLLWHFFPLKSHATFLWNFLTHWDVLSVKAITTFWGGGVGFKVWTFLSVINITTESLYRKMNVFVSYSCCSIFTKQLIFRSINFVMN